MSQIHKTLAQINGHATTLVWLLSLTVLLLTALPAKAQPPLIITTDTVLSTDRFGGVVIGADEITLDCAGHMIAGTPASNGIEVRSRRGVTIRNCTVSGFLNGIQIGPAASASLVDTTVENNVLQGLNIDDHSHVAFAGAFTSRSNGLFGILMINSASARLNGAQLVIESNTAGIQVSLNSSLFVDALPPSPPSSIVAQDNAAFGLTVVSSSHIFLFGQASVLAQRNASNGLSIFTQSALEMDNGPTFTALDNTLNGILIEDSTLNIFNMPQFPGANMALRNNGKAGVSVSKEGVFDIGNEATVTIENNAIGLWADDGSSVRVQSSTIVNNDQDVRLSFGSRGEFQGNTIGTLSCDKTVLIRGDVDKCK